MKFYLVRYRDEGSPEECGGQYFWSKKQAEAFEKSIRADIVKPVECPYCKNFFQHPVQKCPGCGEFWNYTTEDLEALELEVIELTGTTKEMCWQALHHQIVNA